MYKFMVQTYEIIFVKKNKKTKCQKKFYFMLF